MNEISYKNIILRILLFYQNSRNLQKRGICFLSFDANGSFLTSPAIMVAVLVLWIFYTVKS